MIEHEIYEHFKGGKYRVVKPLIIPNMPLFEGTWAPSFVFPEIDTPIWVSNDIDSGDECVLYQSLDRNYYCIRTIESFNSSVTRPRFARINDD